MTVVHRRNASSRPRLRVCIVVVLLVVAVAGVLLWHFVFSPGGASGPVQAQEGQNLEQVHSSVDADGDGIDDQLDILQGAKDYVAGRPKYGSNYYEGGYPTDNQGVCADVLAFALKAAGYDLRELVDKDIAAAPSAYGISEPDSNIDFRRVKNLQVYLKRHAKSLTTDLSQTGEWQGGDIITFAKHIAIVSDKRNERGVPYVVHLSPTQTAYEEDFLEWSTDIVGHYRWSE